MKKDNKKVFMEYLTDRYHKSTSPVNINGVEYDFYVILKEVAQELKISYRSIRTYIDSFNESNMLISSVHQIYGTIIKATFIRLNEISVSEVANTEVATEVANTQVATEVANTQVATEVANTQVATEVANTLPDKNILIKIIDDALGNHSGKINFNEYLISDYKEFLKKYDFKIYAADEFIDWMTDIFKEYINLYNIKDVRLNPIFKQGLLSCLSTNHINVGENFIRMLFF